MFKMVSLQKLVFSDRPDSQNRDSCSKGLFCRSGPTKPEEFFKEKTWIELTLQLYSSMDLVWVFVDSGKHNERRNQETNGPPRYRTSVYVYVCSMALSHVLTPPLFFCITVFTIQPAYLCAFKVISATIQFTIFIVLIHRWNVYITYTCNCT